MHAHTHHYTCVLALTVCLLLHQHVWDGSHKLLHTTEAKTKHREVLVSVALQDGEGGWGRVGDNSQTATQTLDNMTV